MLEIVIVYFVKNKIKKCQIGSDWMKKFATKLLDQLEITRK